MKQSEYEDLFREEEKAPESVATTDQSQQVMYTMQDNYSENAIFGQILLLLNKINLAREERGCGYMFESNAATVRLAYHLVEDPNDMDRASIHQIVTEYPVNEADYNAAYLKIYDALLKIAEMRGIKS